MTTGTLRPDRGDGGVWRSMALFSYPVFRFRNRSFDTHFRAFLLLATVSSMISLARLDMQSSIA